MKNGTEVTLNLSSNVIGDFNDDTNFPDILLLTNTQLSKIHKTFANSSTTNTIFLKTQLSKMSQLGGISGKLLRPLIKTGLPLIKTVLMLLAKSFCGTILVQLQHQQWMQLFKRKILCQEQH